MSSTIRPTSKAKSSSSSPSFTIAGNVQADGVNLAGATLVLSGGASATTTTDASGNYSFTANAGGDYVVTVYKSGYVFTPTNQSFTNLQTNAIANFLTGAPLCAPQSLGLVGWYRAENNATDASGNGNNGTLQNGAGFSNGKVGQNFNLDGVNDYVDIPDVPSTSPTTAVSLQAWIKPRSVGTGQAIISNLNASTDNGTFHFVVTANGGLQFNVQQSTTVFRSASTNPSVITANVYTHVAATFDTSTQAIKIYVNGVDMPTTITGSNVTSLFDVATHPRIGAYTITGTFGAPFNGEIDEAQIYNRALSQVEVQNNYTAGSAGMCRQLSPAFWLKAEGNPKNSAGTDTATAQGGVTYGAGRVNQAFNLDGSTASIKITETLNLLNFGSGDFAIETWVKFTKSGTQSLYVNAYRTPNVVSLTINSSNQARFFIRDGSNNSATVVGANALNNGVWHHLVGQRNGTTASLYVDGALQGSQTNASLGTINVDCGTGLIGGDTGTTSCDVTPTSSFYGGLIDEFQIYKLALSASEIQTEYLVGSNGASPAWAFAGAAGALDASFGPGGKVVAPVGQFIDNGYAEVIQPDGKIVVAGSSSNGSNLDFAVARFNTDGTLDASFGTGGKVTTAIGNSSENAFAVAIQADGKIVAAGNTFDGVTRNFALVRYNSNGTLDATFGTGGKVTTDDPGVKNDDAYAVAIQADGKIVIAGTVFTGPGSAQHFAVARYLSNGTLDTSFASGAGISYVNFGGINSVDAGQAVAIQGDGKIVVAGYTIGGGGDNDIAVARLNSDGSQDNSFGPEGTGTATTQPGLGDDFGYAIAIQPDGKILVSGSSSNGSNADFVTVRYDPDGLPDFSFNENSYVITPIGTGEDVASAVKIQGDGKIVAAGRTTTNSNTDFAIVRYSANGSLDTSFNSTGKVTTAIGAGEDRANALAIQNDGKLVAAGWSLFSPDNDFAVVRYNADGTKASAAPFSNVYVTFANLTRSGNTVATPLISSQLSSLPAAYTLPANVVAYDIRSSVGYSGNVSVTLKVPSVANNAACDLLRSLHFENGAWTAAANATSSYDAATLTCSVSQTVSSLSPFVVAQLGAPEPQKIQFSQAVYSASENGGQTLITVIRTGGSSGTATVDYATSNGLAIAGSDYTAASGTLTFNPGEVSKTVAVPILDDVIYEGDETLNLTLTNVSGSATAGTPTATVLTILENESPPTISINDVSVLEPLSGTTTATFTVNLSTASPFSVTVDFATANNTAVAPGDYVAIPTSTLTFSSGETSKTISVTVNSDALLEGNENYLLNLSNPVNASINDGQAVGFIRQQYGNGKIIFQSNRSGNSEIYSMNATDGSALINLTNNAVGGGDEDIEPHVSPDGSKIVFVSNLSGGLYNLWSMNIDGTNRVHLTQNAVTDHGPSWSPDGTKIAFTSNQSAGAVGIWKANADGSNRTELTAVSGETAVEPSWSPDGSKIAFAGNRDGNYQIYVMNADGSGLMQITYDAAVDSHPKWSPDGSRILFWSNRDGHGEIYVMNADGGGQTRVTTGTAANDTAAWSPDGSRIVFRSNRDGNTEIYVMNSDGSSQTRLTNNALTDDNPCWQPVAPTPGVLQFSAATYSANENGGSITITVTRTVGNADPVTVNYATSNGSASAGSDYVTASGTLTWAAEDSSARTFTVQIFDDIQVEGTETVNLLLSSPTNGATLGVQSSAVINILDNDVPGQLDLGFGTSGKTTTQLGTSDDAIYGVAVQPDGKIVAVGSATNTTPDFGLVRYRTDGTLDSTFGVGGKVIMPVGSSSDVAYSVALQADGKIVVAGTTYNGSNYDFAVLRFLSNGSLDTSFGAGGIATTVFGAGNDVAYAVVIQPDGKIIAGGYGYSGVPNYFALARYDTNGILDPSFGTGGKVLTPIGGSDDYIASLALQADGKIVAAGYAALASNIDVALARYNTDGSLDTSFNGSGKVTTAIGTQNDVANSVQIQTDGKIVAAGYATSASNIDIALVRYNPNGSLDSLFGGSGKVVTPIGSANDYAKAAAIQPNGKIIVAGTSFTGSNSDFVVARYNSNGTLDTTFNGTGKTVTAIGTGNDEATAIGLQSDGKFVVGGFSFNGSNNDFAIVRYVGDYIPPAVQFSAAAYSAVESDGGVVITVKRSGDLGAVATVNYATSDGTALAGSDYNAASGTLTFNTGDVVKTFFVSFLSDSLNEGNETVNLTLSNVSGAALGTPITAVLGIDDRPPNNDFANAQTINGAFGSVTGSLINASRETGEPFHAGADGHNSVWYRWIAPASGTAFFTTKNSGPDTLLAIYTGTSVSGLTLVASNDDANSGVKSSALSFTATAGTEYRIAIDAFRGNLGDGVSFGKTLLNWSIGSRIAGHLTLDLNGNALSGRQILLSGSASRTTTTDAAGFYSFEALPVGGSYTVSGDGTIPFVPTQLNYPGLSGIVFDADFLERGISTKTVTQAGKVFLSANVPLEGVTVHLNGTTTRVTASNGAFVFPGLPQGGSYELEPDTTIPANGFLYTFSPVKVSNLSGNNFAVSFTVVSQSPVYDISGQIRNSSGQPISGVTVTLTGGSRPPTQTDANGLYSFDDLASGINYSVTATMAGVNFSQPTLNFNNLNANQKIADFVAANPTVTVAVSPTSVSEDGATNLVYTFTRSGATSGDLAVNFSVGGTASFGTDYTQSGAGTFGASSGTVTIGTGNSSASVTIDPTTDTTFESDETVVLSVTTGAGYDVGNPSVATGTITNDDSAPQPGTLQFSAATYDQGEGAGTATITVTRTGGSSGAASVQYSNPAGGSANGGGSCGAGVDYVTPSGTLNWNDGDATDKTFTVTLCDDSLVESNETINLALSNATGATLGSQTTATLTINDDDTDVSVASAPTIVAEDGAANLVYTFTRNGVTSGALTVNFSVGGTATFNTDYTQSGAATFTASSGTVTFGAGNSTATVTIDPTVDSTVEPDETAVLTVTSGAGYNVSSPSAATGTITNDDTDVTVAVAPGSVTEDGATNLVYTFTRNGVTSGALTVNFSVGGTATFNTDYTQSGAATFTASSGTVTFGAGNSNATVTLDPTVDSTVEADETAILTVTAGTGYNVSNPSAATGTITNDDGAGLRIDTVAPAAGRTSGGQQIQLTGNFAGLSTVTMGGASATWSYTNGGGDTSAITVTTPAHAVGAVQIDLTPTSGSPYTKTNAFAYLPTVFTDDNLTVGVTIVKAQHIIELREAVDAMRAVAGLAPAPWTNVPLIPGSSFIRAADIQELRTYLDDAAIRLGYPTSPYSDPGLTTGYFIKRIHIEELRQRIRNIAG